VAPVSNDLSVYELVLDASPVVQAVMLLLMAASLASWTVIFGKRGAISRSRRHADQFEASFWSGGDLGALYRSIETKGRAGTGMQSIFESGFGEFSRLRQLGTPSELLLEGAQRSMRVAQMREMDRLEKSLAMLATIGSTSPYVGLFGTVWGIMSAFHGLGNVQQATLAAVAPGISEALITTAMGLFAAIPAVIAYNRFADQVSRLELRFDTFMEEFSTILQRHAATRGAAA
jgi:biopolymer transport protein TolQ